MRTLLERKRLSSYGRGESASDVAEAPEMSGHGNDGSLELFRSDCISRVMRGSSPHITTRRIKSTGHRF